MDGKQELSEVDCLDCGREYPHGLDMVLTRKQWLMVNPDCDGVLCPSCLVNRAGKIEGSLSVYAHVVLGQHYGEIGTLDQMLVALRLENAAYASENGDLKHRIAELEAREVETRWISVKERLPEVGERVLVRSDDPYGPGTLATCIFSDFTWADLIAGYSATHWMPLFPPAPREVSE